MYYAMPSPPGSILVNRLVSHEKVFTFLGVITMSDHTSDVDRFKLDPAKFPKRIDVFVSERVVDHIQAISTRSGRSFSESAAVILAQGAEKFDPEQFDS
jgi:hypothetical protein